MLTRRWAAVFLASATGLAACAGEEEPPPASCAEETRDDEFVAGMAKAGDLWSFRLMNSVPAPPDLGDNEWALRIEESGAAGVADPFVGGAGVAGLTVTITPEMADHDHGTVIKAEIVDEGGGDYSAAPVNLWMRGLWLVTVEASSDTATDSATFAFCVEK
jgi:hypothetical protein